MSTPPRPRQVTVAGWLVMLGGIAVVVSVWEQISGLRTLDSQAVWQKVLDQPPLSGSGVSLDQVLDVVQALAMVAGACAAAAVILGWHALQRSRPALIALTVVSVPLFLAGLASGAVFPTVVVVAVVMLWLQPSRDWYAGRERPVTPSPRPVDPAGTAAHRAHQVNPVHQAHPSHQAGTPVPPPPAGYRMMPSREHAQAAVSTRPGAVTVAAVITWVSAALMVVLLVVSVVAVSTQPATAWRDAVKDYPQLSQDGYTSGDLVTSMVVVAVLGIVWMLAAAAMALLVWLRIAWARTVLMVLASVSALVLLFATFVSPAASVPMIGAVLVVALLMRPDVVRWLDGRRSRVSP